MAGLDLKLYNTMTMKKERLAPGNKEVVRMFVCGPTVQSYIHVGHARTYVFYDVLARYLAHLGLRVNFLVNITDIDDRITETAKKERVKTSYIAAKYTQAFLDDLQALRVTSVTKFERVSEYLPIMMDQVSILLQRDYAYVADGVVYFDTSRFPSYGKLSHQSKSELSLRPLELTPNKKNLLDFSLWRPVILEEGRWDSPWGRGSPGWHIEDTAVTQTNFGSQYDIHGGAYELIYPHHEAEIAQGESLTGSRPMVRHWVHTGLVNLSGRKMSKTAGNTALLRELLKKYTTSELRYYLLSWHYRDDAEFSVEGLERAKKAYSKVKSRTKAAPAKRRPAGSKEILAPFYSAMNDDMDTPRALGWVEESFSKLSSSEEGMSALGKVSDVLGVNFVAKK